MEKKQEQVTPVVERRKKPFNRRWLWVGGALLLIGVGIFFGYIWLAGKNVFLGLLTVTSVSTGIFILVQKLKNFSDADNVVIIKNLRKTTGPANCLNIYARFDETTNRAIAEKIVFENVEAPAKTEGETVAKKDENPQERQDIFSFAKSGQPQQCLNDNQWYWVNIFDLQKRCLVPFILPDTRYTPPSLLARYIQIPAQRKYLRHRETWQKYVGPGLLALMDAGGFIAIIALAG